MAARIAALTVIVATAAACRRLIERFDPAVEAAEAPAYFVLPFHPQPGSKLSFTAASGAQYALDLAAPAASAELPAFLAAVAAEAAAGRVPTPLKSSTRASIAGALVFSSADERALADGSAAAIAAIGAAPCLSANNLTAALTAHTWTTAFEGIAYVPGGASAAHRDWPTDAQHWGTAVLLPPRATFTGGDLALGLRTARHVLVASESSDTWTLVGWPLSVEHEVLPVLSGLRVAFRAQLRGAGDEGACGAAALSRAVVDAIPALELAKLQALGRVASAAAARQALAPAPARRRLGEPVACTSEFTTCDSCAGGASTIDVGAACFWCVGSNTCQDTWGPGCADSSDVQIGDAASCTGGGSGL